MNAQPAETENPNENMSSAEAGGARRDRTADLIIANDALSQLSYGPSAARLDAGRQSTSFTVRSADKSRTPNRRFPLSTKQELPLFAKGGTDI